MSIQPTNGTFLGIGNNAQTKRVNMIYDSVTFKAIVIGEMFHTHKNFKMFYEKYDGDMTTIYYIIHDMAFELSDIEARTGHNWDEVIREWCNRVINDKDNRTTASLLDELIKERG